MGSRLEAKNPVLAEILRSDRVRDSSGAEIPLDANNISALYADALYQTILKYAPATVLEIGMAFGISSLAILTALEEIGGDGKLISIDPEQAGEKWRGIGIANVATCGFAGRHVLVEKPDYLALPELLNSGLRVELAYVDGRHTFDYVFLDFFYIDKVLVPGGIVGFNDAGWRAVHKVLKFVTRHRKYAEIEVGLKRTYDARSPLRSQARRVLGAPTQDRYFRKLADWEPAWNFFAEF